jgi:hypothetical protein
MVVQTATKWARAEAPYPLEWIQRFNDGGALYVEGLAIDPTMAMRQDSRSLMPWPRTAKEIFGLADRQAIFFDRILLTHVF